MSNKAFFKQKDLFGNCEIVFTKGRKTTINKLFEYDEFVGKFKDKKTTDDCYTPKPVFDVILNYLKDKWKMENINKIVRPFFPGNDYKSVKYPKGCIVVDNPPFSIYTQIVRFYISKKISFFLFAPHLTMFSPKHIDANFIVVGADITYENGAVVKTSFVSNLFGDKQVFSDLELYDKLNDLNIKKTPLPKYKYPDNIMTVSDFSFLLNKGIEFEVSKNECVFVSKLDDQKKYKKAIFGSGLMMIEAKAKAKAKEGNMIEFKLSNREKEILKDISS